ncbi:MAG: UbiA family prenyltransferase [Planctomycetota bacterium]|nr:UbiA family prenyltransferase [Planctomycetota bacterium]
MSEPIASVPLSSTPSSTRTIDVLFVDLDGTLIATDLLQESVLLAVKRAPGLLLKLPELLWGNRAQFKQQLAAQVSCDPRVLPYRQEVLDYIHQQKAADCVIVLATASDQAWANSVAAELQIFDDVLASDGERNLKGANKLVEIQKYCTQHGYQRFGYIGDHVADLPIWKEADEVQVVAPGAVLKTKLGELNKPVHTLCERKSIVRPLIKALRPHQWMKNLLLFVPLVLAHEVESVDKLIKCCWAFVAFSFVASAVYLLNDLLDIESDRHHPKKRRRPFASGSLPVAYGPALIVILLLVSTLISLVRLPPKFLGGLCAYAVLNLLYSFWLKRKLAIDVIVLAGMYTLRVVVGGLATGVDVSEWLLAFSLFFFTSLAFIKRFTELSRLAGEDSKSARGRGYVVGDLSMIESIGPTSGYMSVLVLALYVNSQNSKELYSHSWALWLICPLMMYWITRIWFVAKRGELDEDPLVYAFRDRISVAIGLCMVALVAIATRG